MKLKVLIWQEEDIWCASVPALPGCHTWGENYDHLMEMLSEAVEGWLEVASEQDQTNDQKQLISHLLLQFQTQLSTKTTQIL